ncbi:MAG TPA: STAS domain-containing protein [Bryobacteraceae bacterium]|nr:STAS domain-containing protein [Bryobacteraceae bacterium]
MALQIEQTEIEPGVFVIALSGRMMLGSASQQLETLIPELLAQGHRTFIFDLSGITHIDSTGIGKFIFAMNRIMQAGGRMYMAGATGQVRAGFAVTRLDTVFQFFPDVASARHALP